MAERFSVDIKAASWMRPFLWTLALAILGIPAAGEGIPSSKAHVIREILAASIRSQSTRNVRGTQMEWVQTPSGPNQITFKEYRRSKDGRSLTTITDSNGRQLSVVADDGVFTRTYDARTRVVTITRSVRIPTDEKSISTRVHRILSSYRVTYSSQAVMAGRQCHKLILDPHDTHGRPIRVWIDKGTGVTLAREESDRRGFSFGMTAFNAVSYPARMPIADTALKLEKGARFIKVSRSPMFRDPGSLKMWAKIDIILPISMPRGFEFEAGEMISLAGTDTVCLRYSDGLAMITIFQTQSNRVTEHGYQSVAWKMLPRGENVAVAGHTRVTSVIMGPRESESILSVARALDRAKEKEIAAYFSRAYHIDESILRGLRDRGLGFDTLGALLEIGRRSGTKLSSLLSLRGQGWNWRQIAARFHIPVKEVFERVRDYECR